MSKQRRPLTVGDRCKVYTGRECFKGKVYSISPQGNYFVIEDGFYSAHREAPFHPKQCRRLKPRKRPEEKERAERWVITTNVPLGYESVFKSQGEASVHAGNPLCAPRKFVELRAGEIILDRENLASVWDAIRKDPSKRQFFGTAHCAAVSFDFKELVEALGLGLSGKEPQ